MKLSSIHPRLWFAAIALAGLVGTFVFAVKVPPPELADDEGLVYHGPETETVPVDGAGPEALVRADAAFDGVVYYAAYAEGPDGRTGLWTGAHRADRAREYALALCGADCAIVAERLPVGRDGSGLRAVPPEMAAGLKARIWRGDKFARGGANAWGAAVDTGRFGHARAERRALAECNARLGEEDTPRGITPEPCRASTYLGFHERRPDPVLYPASYEMGLTDLVPVEAMLERREINRGRRLGSHFEAPNPKGLHGASAMSPDGARGHVRVAGWPEAGEALALLDCDTDRRFADAPCVVSKSMVPTEPVPTDALAVSAALHDAFLAWQATEGAGAFAISPFGAWGSSSGYADSASAIQKAADWCLYYGRRSRAEFDFDYNFIEVDIPCRIVAMREADAIR